MGKKLSAACEKLLIGIEDGQLTGREQVIKELYPNGRLTRDWYDRIINETLSEFSRRTTGDYTGCGEDNQALLARRIRRKPVYTLPGHTLKKWNEGQDYWPMISNATWKFHSAADFIRYQLPLVQSRPDIRCRINLGAVLIAGPRDDDGNRDMTYTEVIPAKHEKCYVVDGNLRGCEICEMLALLDAHVDNPLNLDPIGDRLMNDTLTRRCKARMNKLDTLDTRETKETSFRLTIRRRQFEITGRYAWNGEREGVRSLIIEGPLGYLDWGLWRKVNDEWHKPQAEWKDVDRFCWHEKCNGLVDGIQWRPRPASGCLADFSPPDLLAAVDAKLEAEEVEAESSDTEKNASTPKVDSVVAVEELCEDLIEL